MMHVTNLAGNNFAALLRAMFLNRMPQEVRTILSSSTATTNVDFAKEANVVLAEYLLACNLSPATNSIASLSTKSASPFPEPETTVTEVAAVQRQPRPPPVAVMQGQRAPPPAVPYLCYVHARYGQQAYSCRSTSCPMRNQVRRAPGNFKAGWLSINAAGFQFPSSLWTSSHQRPHFQLAFPHRLRCWWVRLPRFTFRPSPSSVCWPRSSQWICY